MQKSLDSFASRGGGRKKACCKTCWNERSKKARLDSKMRIDNIKAKTGCIDCGEKDPVVLDFDHVRGEKKFNVSDAVGRYVWDTLKKEIDKCVVRCSNCHRRQTWMRRQHKKKRKFD